MVLSGDTVCGDSRYTGIKRVIVVILCLERYLDVRFLNNSYVHGQERDLVPDLYLVAGIVYDIRKARIHEFKLVKREFQLLAYKLGGVAFLEYVISCLGLYARELRYQPVGIYYTSRKIKTGSRIIHFILELDLGIGISFTISVKNTFKSLAYRLAVRYRTLENAVEVEAVCVLNMDIGIFEYFIRDLVFCQRHRVA